MCPANVCKVKQTTPLDEEIWETHEEISFEKKLGQRTRHAVQCLWWLMDEEKLTLESNFELLKLVFVGTSERYDCGNY